MVKAHDGSLLTSKAHAAARGRRPAIMIKGVMNEF